MKINEDFISHKMNKTGYFNRNTTSINDLTTVGSYRGAIANGSDDASYLGFSGNVIVEVFGQSSIYYMQRITQMATGRVMIRYSQTNSFDYNTPMFEINNPNVGATIKTYLKEDYTFTGNTTVTLPLTEVHTNTGDCFSVTSDGSVKIGAHVSAVIVSGTAYYYTGTNTNGKILYIYKNGTNMCTYNTMTPSNNYRHFTVGPVVIPVTAGDLIRFNLKADAGDLFKYYSNGTFLSVTCLR